MKFLCAGKKVVSRIKSLKKTGKAGRNLADKAESIIERLASGMIGPDVDIAGRFTKYGEKRIKNCCKYDLGCGYRLITIQRGSTIYLPFLGSHDDCQRWLENNIRLKDINPDIGKMIC